MTTTDPTPDLPAGVIDRPQGDRPILDDLSVRELRLANGKLRGDVAHAITAPTADRWDALALVGWLWHKRQDPQASLDAWLGLSIGQLHQALHLAGDDDQADDGPAAADDTDDQADWTADPGAELEADPTPPGR